MYYDSYDNEPEAYARKERTARKDHVCCECRFPIKSGEGYVEHWGIYDGRHHRSRQHTECESWYDAVNAVFGGGVSFGGVVEAMGDLGGCVAPGQLCFSCGLPALSRFRLLLNSGTVERYHPECLLRLVQRSA